MDLVAYIYTSPRFLLAMGAMALWTWWPIYTPHPVHFTVARVQGDPTHYEEHLQAN
jgi:hypothetical protein